MILAYFWWNIDWPSVIAVIICSIALMITICIMFITYSEMVNEYNRRQGRKVVEKNKWEVRISNFVKWLQKIGRKAVVRNPIKKTGGKR